MIKGLVYASISLFGVLAAVITLSILLSLTLKEIEERVDASAPGDETSCIKVSEEFRDIKSDFDSKLPLLSLLVSDATLLDIEQGFSDVISYADSESMDEVSASARRLAISLEHLRDLAGLSIKSIF